MTPFQPSYFTPNTFLFRSLKYWDRNSTSLDRKDAIVRLGLILEPLKKRVKQVLRADEDDLFNILNNFGLRHSKNAQKTDYDSRVFDSWLFYHYLAAVHAYLKLLEREKSRLSGFPPARE